MGNVSEAFTKAEKEIEKFIGKIIKESSVYKTEPWGNKEQQFFLNKIIIAETKCSPTDLLKYILIIEKQLRRYREKDNQYAPRTIDIDILFMDDIIINTEQLIIPHPRLHLRNFVLVPLSQIAPNFIHPVLHKKIKSLLENSPDNSFVEKL